jgi:hypothetical protein
MVDANYQEYSEIVKEYDVVLPRSGQRVRLKLLDGTGEMAASATKKSERSSHTPILVRNPRYFQKTENGEVPIMLNLDNQSVLDIEFLRKTIREREGRVDTQIMFEHPEAETKVGAEKEVVIDVLGVMAFFFPSEAI